MSLSTGYAPVILEEICLEGLDGITLHDLWIRLAARFKCDVPETLRKKFWDIIINLQDVDFYLLPEPKTELKTFERFVKVEGKYCVSNILDENSQISAIFPVKTDYGSCQHYDTRVNINCEAKSSTLEDAITNWGNCLVVVGTLQARWHALAPTSPTLFEILNKTQYCMLESIGRTRYNGETTWKPVLVNGVTEDAKTLFYYRKNLVEFNLVVKKQIYVKTPDRPIERTTNTLILHLTRFSVPFMLHEEHAVNVLTKAIKASPTQMIPLVKINSIIKNIVSEEFPIKRFLKLSEVSKTIKSVAVPYNEIYPDAKPEQCISKSSGTPICIKVVKLVNNEPQTEVDLNEQELDESEIHEEIIGSSFVGETLVHQAYNCVYEAGSKGLTRTMLSKMLGIDNLTARGLLKRLRYRDNLQSILTEEKRQKQECFVCPDFLKIRNEEFEKEKNKMKRMSKTKDGVVATQCQSGNGKKTLKKLRLTNLILEQVRFRHIVHEISNLTKYCNRKQIAMGVNSGVTDRRTVLRIVRELDQLGQLVFYRIKLEPRYNAKVLDFICEPHIKIDHPFIQSVTEQAKLQVNSGDKGKKLNKQLKKNLSSKRFTCNNSNKFIKTYELHRFLFYIVYEHENKIVKEIEQFSTYDDNFKDLSESEISPVYENAPPGYSFVPPINNYSDLPEGWLVLVDMFLCMPLFVFTSIVSLPVFPLLDEYLKHPVKKQILLKNLPNEIQNAILWKKSFIFTIIERLAYFGLLKFGQRVMKEKFRIFVYLNRYTNLLDTTTSAPVYLQVEDKTYDEELFTLDSLDAVDQYWIRLKYICLHTTMAVQSDVLGQEIIILSPEQKLTECLKSYSVAEAMESDDGTVPGDRRGAGGIDSSLYTHLKRSWGIQEFSVKVPSAIQPHSKSKLKSKLPLTIKTLRNTQIIYGNVVIPKAKGRIIKRTIKPRKRKRLHKSNSDEEDKLATRNMLRQRTYWSAKEDRVVQLAAIAYSILNPKNLFGDVLRELLYRITNVRDKTSVACRRRVLFLKKKKMTSRNMEIHLSEIKRNSTLMTQYAQLYKRLWVKENSPEYPSFLKEIKIHFVELVHYLHRMIYNKEMPKEYLALPATLEDVYSKFHIYSSEIPATENYTEPTAIEDIAHSKVQSVIHIALSSEFESKYNLNSKRHALRVFLQFSEELLRTEVTRINSLGIAVRQKKIKNKTRSLSQLSSSYSLSQTYIYHLCSSTPYIIFAECYDNFKRIVQNNIRTIDCRSVDSGLAVLLTDLISINGLNMKINIPQNILIPDPRCNSNLDDSTTVEENITKILNETMLRCSSVQVVEGSAFHQHETLVINTCQLETSLTCDLSSVFNTSTSRVDELLNKWICDAVFEYDNNSSCEISSLFQMSSQRELAEKLYAFIESKEIMGALCADIKKEFPGRDVHLLQNILTTLKDSKLVFRVGVKNLRWVSLSHFETWFIKIKDPIGSSRSKALKRRPEDEVCSEAKKLKLGKNLEIIDTLNENYPETDDVLTNESIKYEEDDENSLINWCDNDDEVKVTHDTFMCGRIWMQLDGTLNYRIIWRWMGAILCYLVNHPVTSLENLCKRFNLLTSFHIFLLVEMLVDIGCIKLFTIKKTQASLWDDGDELILGNASILDEFCDIDIHLQKDSLSTFSHYRGMAVDAKKLQNPDFIFHELSKTSIAEDIKFINKEKVTNT